MLGMILYEIVDVAYNVSKITYNGARAVYYWYYNMEYPEQEEIDKRNAIIIELTERIKNLEQANSVIYNSDVSNQLIDNHFDEVQIE